MAPKVAAAARWTILGLAALTLLQLLWEIALAPLPTGGVWLALKALPLAMLFPGVARGVRRPRQLLALLLPFYFAEGITRAWSESGRHAAVAAMAAVIAAATLVALLTWFRAERAPK